MQAVVIDSNIRLTNFLNEFNSTYENNTNIMIRGTLFAKVLRKQLLLRYTEQLLKYI